MAKIDLTQLDDFSPTYLDDTVNGDVPVWHGPSEEFRPVPQDQLVVPAQIEFRKIFLLMGA